MFGDTQRITDYQQESHPIMLQYQKAIELLEEVNKKLIKEKRKRRFWQEKVKAIMRCQLFRKYQEEQLQLHIIKDTYDMLKCDVDQGLLNMKLKGLPPGVEIHSNEQQSSKSGNKENYKNTPLKIKISENSKKIKKADTTNQSKNNKEDILVFPSSSKLQQSQLKQQNENNHKTKPEKQQSQNTTASSGKKQKSKSKSSTANQQSSSGSKKSRTMAIDQFIQESIRQAKESIKNSGILQSTEPVEQDQKSKHLIEICDENSNQSVIIQGAQKLSSCVQFQQNILPQGFLNQLQQ
ncbi:UNKNOWN [Stylonychia lemnae]|uniref:Uncharacterized protein n=1 Tax=Stylonychia lemnae TaxID=5949 RepID=A0A077ZYF3_STYLE|nr:UNKNOWN [Stylonychia lemnae]|eukprot:CDW74895.1 UNKNOWN [Stylonychia lemnae]